MAIITVLAVALSILEIIFHLSGALSVTGMLLIIFGCLFPMIRQYQAELRFERDSIALLPHQKIEEE